MSKQKSSLLDNAFSKLQPRVFSHPVWIRFGNKEVSTLPLTIKALFIEAENLKQRHPSDACQVLLICAVFQHYSGQTENALATIQDMQNLAEKASLDQEIIWALWGACAICVQHKNFDQASTYLSSLKRLLSDQNDWVLTDFIDIVKQTLTQSNTLQVGYHENQPSEDVLNHTFRWLNHWGFSTQDLQVNLQTSNNQSHNQHRPLSRLSITGWRSLSLLFRSELKVHWLKNNSGQRKRRSTFWGYILSLFHIEVTTEEQEDKSEVIDSEVIPPEVIMVDQIEEVAPVIIQEAKINQNGPISISAQMLGNFYLTIDETVLDLPSSRSLSLLKYLLLNHRQHTPRETLIDMFWPDTPMERGRNNLNVAMNGIRTSLRMVTDAPVIFIKTALMASQRKSNSG